MKTAVTAHSQSEPCTVRWFAPVGGGLTFRASLSLAKMRAGIVVACDDVSLKSKAECVVIRVRTALTASSLFVYHCVMERVEIVLSHDGVL